MGQKTVLTNVQKKFLGLVLKEPYLNKEDLKVDFNFYPFPRIDKRSKWKGLTIDSLFDIAVNKIQTLSTNPRARDFVDLYFIFQQQEQPLTLKRLIEFAKIKFDWHIEPVQLGENFAKVITFQDFPKIYLPFERKTMTNFFLSLSRELKTEIFTNPTS